MTEEELKILLEILTESTNGPSQLNQDLMNKMTYDWYKWLNQSVELCRMADCPPRDALMNISTVALTETTKMLIKMGFTQNLVHQSLDLAWKAAQQRQKESKR